MRTDLGIGTRRIAENRKKGTVTPAGCQSPFSSQLERIRLAVRLTAEVVYQVRDEDRQEGTGTDGLRLERQTKE